MRQGRALQRYFCAPHGPYTCEPYPLAAQSPQDWTASSNGISHGTRDGNPAPLGRQRSKRVRVQIARCGQIVNRRHFLEVRTELQQRLRPVSVARVDRVYLRGDIRRFNRGERSGELCVVGDQAITKVEDVHAVLGTLTGCCAENPTQISTEHIALTFWLEVVGGGVWPMDQSDQPR